MKPGFEVKVKPIWWRMIGLQCGGAFPLVVINICLILSWRMRNRFPLNFALVLLVLDLITLFLLANSLVRLSSIVLTGFGISWENVLCRSYTIFGRDARISERPRGEILIKTPDRRLKLNTNLYQNSDELLGIIQRMYNE